MYFSVSTTHRPAADLGYLLMKHPDRVHEAELGFGHAVVFFPEAGSERCEAVLALDIDPVALVRGKGKTEGLEDQYVNDRAYAASSFLSVALNRVYRSAMAGQSRERPGLAALLIPLELVIKPLPVNGPPGLVRDLFEPLGWTVDIVPLPGEAASSRYVELRLKGSLRLRDALSHVYVLVPVLDDEKHYWAGDDEVEKLLLKGEAWLSSHPARDLIARRYLKNRRDLTQVTLARLSRDMAVPFAAAGPSQDSRENTFEAPLRLHDRRLDTVAALLVKSGARRVADLGCGDGRLIEHLVRHDQFETIIGLDASTRVLERAMRRLKLGQPGGPKEGRVVLLHGALTYRDARWQAAEAAALVEVVEHLDPDRLAAMTAVVFGAARPTAVIVTTPNADYNALFPALDTGTFRHPDHRFEWTRPAFRAWASAIAPDYGYQAAFSGIGDDHPEFGPVTQAVVFSR